MDLNLLASVDVQAEVNVSDIIDEFNDEQKIEIARYCCNSIDRKDVKVIVSKEKFGWKSYLVLLCDNTYCIVFGQHKEDVITFLNRKNIKYVAYMSYVVPMAMKHIDNLVIYGTQVVKKVLDEIRETKFNAIWDNIIH